MTNEQLVEEFYKIWKESGIAKSNINVYVRNHYTSLYSEIERRTIKLNQYKKFKQYKDKKLLCDISIFERIYCLLHNLDDRPLCKTCGKKKVAGFFVLTQQYGDYCSQYCQRRSPICISKQLTSKEKKYGKENITNSKKAHQTRVQRYGSHHPKDYAQKVKSTKLKNYGNENYTNVDKMRHTVEQHKKENPNYYYDREQKTKQTKIANGHDPNWNNRSKFKQTVSSFSDDKKNSINEKRKQTCLNDYGVESIAQLESVKNQKKTTCLSRYGKESFLATEQCQTKSKVTKKKQAWKYFNEECKDIIPLFTENEFTNCNLNEKQKIWNWKCKKCGHEFSRIWANWHSRRCPKCYPQNFRGMQTEVENFVSQLCVGYDIRRDCKSVLDNARQLDIYIPSLSIAIEFNGLFWHNSDKCAYGKTTPMMYHYDKSSECSKKGIRLVHIFEDQWYSNAKLCKSKLKKMLFPKKVKQIDGWQCCIEKNIDGAVKHKMLCKYSFDGDDGSSVQYGLTYKGHLIAMMTFSKSRNNKQYQWQILNYIEVNSFIIDGGFEVLFDAFVNDFRPISVCMYMSRDLNTPNNFKSRLDYVKLNSPRLYWTYRRERIKSTVINKSNVKDILQTYDESKSFLQNMNANGYYRIYDSGTLVFEKIY